MRWLLDVHPAWFLIGMGWVVSFGAFMFGGEEVSGRATQAMSWMVLLTLIALFLGPRAFDRE